MKGILEAGGVMDKCVQMWTRNYDASGQTARVCFGVLCANRTREVKRDFGDLRRRGEGRVVNTSLVFKRVLFQEKGDRENKGEGEKDTRWESRAEALKPLRYQLGGIYDALPAVCNNSEIDNSIRVEASGLLNCVKQFKFLCCIVIRYKILNCINPISKLLQTKDYYLPSAMELLKNCKDFFKDLRSDTAFNEMLCDARELADEIDIAVNFELTQPRRRVRRRNVSFDYEARDDPIEDPTLKYRAEFYFFTLDKAINALESRGSAKRLATIAIEHELAEEIDVKEIIKKFSELKEFIILLIMDLTGAALFASAAAADCENTNDIPTPGCRLDPDPSRWIYTIKKIDSVHVFTCRNCGGGDRVRVAIYRPFGDVSLSLNRTVTCMVLNANDRRTSCPCHD
ncbi:DUF4371 domain-containing protein [Trichonephila clavipes]|nr:DUF4371 domain-containing protein [Trichonephila clavipes]